MSTRHGTWANPDIVAEPRSIWSRRNLAVAGAVVVMAFLLFGAIGYGINSMFTGTDVYKLSMALVKSDRSVQLAVGERIETGWLTTGNVTLIGSGGNAELSIPISGALNSATVHSRATRAGGVWKIESLTVQVKGDAAPIVLIDENRNRGPQRVAYS